MKIAAQLYTVRDLIKTGEGLRSTLARLRESGYVGAQFSAVGCMNGDSPEVSPAEAKKLLDDLGMHCCATHRPLERLLTETQAEIDFHLALGSTQAGIGAPGPTVKLDSLDDWKKLADDLGMLTEAFGRHGIGFGYHNHALEWQKVGPDGTWPFEVLLERCPAELHFIVDTYWVAVAGFDPAALLRRLKGRISVIHAKDLLPHEWQVRDVPVGEGNLDWDAILGACHSGGTEWVAVEQDNCWRDHFDSMDSSAKFLAARL
jgi:sugar phosphate isomerase/epimerase